MATYERFEDLPVWQSAIELAEGCEDFLLAAKTHITWSKRDQLDRCSLSVANNIAEGFERGTTNELLSFLYIARGSAGETRSMLAYFARRPSLHPFRNQIASLQKKAESCCRQLRAWADSLQNSSIKGQRHLNEKSKQAWEKQQAREKSHREWQEMELNIVRKMSPHHPARREYERRHGPIS